MQMVRQKDHLVLNVYGDESVEIVEEAIEAAQRAEGADDVSEAIEMVCRAYMGYTRTG